MSASTVLIGVSFDNLIRSKEVAAKFLDAFASIYPELKFEFMGEPSIAPRNMFDRISALNEWEFDRGSQGVVQGGWKFEGRVPAPFQASVIWSGPGTHPVWSDSIVVTFNERFWLETLIDRPSSRGIGLLKALTALGSPLYARAYHWSEFEEKGFITSQLSNGETTRHTISLRAREGLEDIFWVNFFGKPYVDIVGKEDMRGIDCTEKEELGDGFLMTFGSDPFQWKTSGIRTLQNKAKKKLDHGIFYDKTTNLKPSLNLFSKSAVSRRTPLGQTGMSSALSSADNFADSSSIASIPSLSMSSGLRACPTCGESKNIEEVPRDSNNLVGFKCLNCGGRWLVDGSLL